MNQFKKLCFIVLFVFASGKDLPKGISRCSIADTPCRTRAVKEIFTVLKGGASEYGIPEIDPMVINELIIEQGQPHNPVHLKINFTDLKLTGLSTMDFFNATLDVAKNTMGIDSLAEDLVMVAQYEMTGKVLLLSLGGKGNCKINLSNLFASSDIQFKQIRKKSDVYWDIIGYKLKINPEKVQFYFENLLNTNQAQLGEGLNRFMNENWSIIFDSLKPSLEDTFTQILKNALGWFFRKVPINKLFIDAPV